MRQASSAILLETPSRQMVPFSPFDATLGDANMLIMAKSGGGKTFMAQLLLLMLARTGHADLDSRARRFLPPR